MGTSDLDIFHDVKATTEGISVTTYSWESDSELVVEDETWVTWSELDDCNPN